VKVTRFFAVLAAVTSLFALHAGAQGVAVHPQPAPAGASTPHQPTPEQIAKMPVTALPIKDFKLLSSGTGWASTGARLFFTTDNGAHWKDISPPNPNRDELASVFFNDADTGWVLVAHHIQGDENPTPDSPDNDQTFYVSATANGGTTWTSENLPVWKGQHGLTDNGIIVFADKLHGWISLDEARSMAFASSVPLSTSDGGRTWNWARSGVAGSIDGILAVTDKDIWMIGRSGEDGGSQLGMSHDGGESYQAVALPVPKEFAQFGYPEYSLPTFTDSLNGYEAVTYSDSEASKSVAVLFATQDGGRTWKQDRILTNLAESSVGSSIRSTVAGSTWIRSFAPHGSQPTLTKILPKSGTTDGANSPVNSYNCDLSFLTPSEGWMNCSGNLTSTIDGGASWTTITPRARNGVLTTDPVTPMPATKPMSTLPPKLTDPKTVPTAADTPSDSTQN
jgi:photosystem II stability/assembly factor-like uncharacterized protein